MRLVSLFILFPKFCLPQLLTNSPNSELFAMRMYRCLLPTCCDWKAFHCRRLHFYDRT